MFVVTVLVFGGNSNLYKRVGACSPGYSMWSLQIKDTWEQPLCPLYRGFPLLRTLQHIFGAHYWEVAPSLWIIVLQVVQHGQVDLRYFAEEVTFMNLTETIL